MDPFGDPYVYTPFTYLLAILGLDLIPLSYGLQWALGGNPLAWVIVGLSVMLAAAVILIALASYNAIRTAGAEPAEWIDAVN